MGYDDLELKIPVESSDYPECSQFVTETTDLIIQKAMDTKKNKIIINTNPPLQQ